MNRIEKTFLELKGKTAFIGFVTLGDPLIEKSKEIIKTMACSGCDIIELGLPFSDPCAEGEVIQKANIRALNAGMNTVKAMQMVKELRQEVKTPFVYLLYYNQIFRYGIEKFLKECASSGIDGLIIPDLPYEHFDEIEPLCKHYQIEIISLVTPISGKRENRIASKAKGFLYCVTSLGVTGVRNEFEMNLKAFMESLSRYTNTPKALGFGIGTVKQIKQLKEYAEGIIIGSAIVNEVEKIANHTLTIHEFGDYIKELADACHE